MANVADITVELQAGNAKFNSDIDQAKVKLHEFGAVGVSEHKALAAAMKGVEGGLAGNARAAEEFLAKFTGIGPIVQAAFPVLGAIAFGGVIVELGKKVYEFFKQMEEAPAKMAEAFRSLNAPLELTNDELRLANDHLDQDIAKLEGKRQNNLAIALDEARVMADRLAASLDKSFESLQKVFADNSVSKWHIFTEGNTKVKEDAKQFKRTIDDHTDTARDDIDAAGTDQTKLNAANLKARNALAADYTGELKKQQGILDTTQTIANASKGMRDYTADIDSIKEYIRWLKSQREEFELTYAHADKEKTKADLTTAKQNADLIKPFEELIRTRNAELKGLQEQLAAIGRPESESVTAKADSAYDKDLADLDSKKEKLTDVQKAQLHGVEASLAQTEADKVYQTQIVSANKSLDERIKSYQDLTAAIGQNFEAAKKASRDTAIAKQFHDHLNDSTWMDDPTHQADMSSFGDKSDAAFDAEHGATAAKALQALNNQIGLEKQLAASQSQGAEAVRQATLAYQALEITRTHNAEDAARLIAAERELSDVKKNAQDAKTLATLKQETDAQNALAQAAWNGAEALRQQTLENKYAAMKQGGTSSSVIDAERAKDAATHQAQLTEEAAKLTDTYSDQLAKLDQQEAVLKAQQASGNESLSLAIAIRDVENQRLQILVKQTLQQGTAQAGVKAFFLEMQEDGKKLSDIVYDSLNSAFDKLSDQLGDLLTGKKTSFAKTFEDIGQQLTKSVLKSELQKGLGAIGSKIFGQGNNPLAGKPDGSSQDKALWVRQAGTSSNGQNGSGGAPSGKSGVPGGNLGGLLGSGGGLIKNVLGGLVGLFGGGVAGGAASDAGDGLTEAVTSSISYLATGGDVDPGRGYVVGDGGEPEFFSPKVPGTITPMSKIPTGNGDVTYNIDARNADLGAAGRVSQAIQAAHQSAVSTAYRAVQEKRKRSPQRTRR